MVIVRHPRNAPDWTYVDQDIPAGAEFSVPATEAEGDDVEAEGDDVEGGGNDAEGGNN